MRFSGVTQGDVLERGAVAGRGAFEFNRDGLAVVEHVVALGGTGVGGLGLTGDDRHGVAAVQGDGDVTIYGFAEADREGLRFGFGELGFVGHDADGDAVATVGRAGITGVTGGAGFVGDGDAGVAGGDEVFELAVAVVEHGVNAIDQGVLAAHEGVIGGGHGGAAAELSGGDGDGAAVGQAELEAVVAREVGALRAG